MPTLQVIIVDRGTPTIDINGNPTTSQTGHMWYVITDDNGNEFSYGFAPREDHQGEPFAPGKVYTNDNSHYAIGEGDYVSQQVTITQEQFNKLDDFGKDPKNNGGFDTYYDGLKNSCIDFTWKALAVAGFNTKDINGNDYEGDFIPTWNINNIEEVLSGGNHKPFKPLTAEDLNYTPSQYLQEISDNWGIDIVTMVNKYPELFNPFLAIDSVKDLIKNELKDILQSTQTISNELLSSYNKFLASVNTVFVRIKDPLIIDNGNDGLELNSLETSGVLFDLDGDGNSESTGWVKSSSEGGDELFLAIDKNQNGNIDSIEELFGNDTTGGFAELSVYDSNQDNIINSSDSQFNLLKIWNDANANGIVDSGEINSLTNHNITSISLNTSNYITTINGNNVTAVANVNFTDGSVKKIYEVWFGSNEFNSAIANPDVALGSDFELNLEVLTQAFSRGYGELSSWQIAMSNNTDLLNLSKQINNLTPNQFNQIDDLFSQFLFKWADVEDATNASVYNGAETGFDPRKMAFLEKITGLDFNYTTQNAIPLAVTAWNSFYNNLLNRFLIQGTLNEIFPNAHYDFTTDTLTLNNTLDEVITNILSLSNQMDESSFLNYAYYAQNILQLNRDQFNDVDFDAKVNAAITSIINSASVEGFAFNGVFNIGFFALKEQPEWLFLAKNANKELATQWLA